MFVCFLKAHPHRHKSQEQIARQPRAHKEKIHKKQQQLGTRLQENNLAMCGKKRRRKRRRKRHK